MPSRKKKPLSEAKLAALAKARDAARAKGVATGFAGQRQGGHTRAQRVAERKVAEASGTFTVSAVDAAQPAAAAPVTPAPTSPVEDPATASGHSSPEPSSEGRRPSPASDARRVLGSLRRALGGRREA